MNILLATPIELKDRDEGELRSVSPHLGLAYLASYLKNKGINVKIVDGRSEKLKLESFLDVIKEYRPSLIGFTAYTVEMGDIKSLVKSIKEVLPEVKIVVGGPHTSAIPLDTVKEFENVDYVIAGEGEIPLYKLCLCLQGNGKLEDVPNLFYKNKNEVISSKEQNVVEDVNNIPAPDWSLFPLGLYKGHHCENDFFKSKDDDLELPLITMRGCPYKCIFCFKTTKLSRYRKVDDVLDEMKNLVEKYNVKRFYFIDGTFGLPRKRIEELCKGIIKLGLNDKIRWAASTRVDILDEELLKLVMNSGCKYLTLGVESGSNKILDIMRKGVTREMIIEKFAMINKFKKENGLKVNGSFVFGVPHETKETLEETIDLVKKIKLDQVSFSILVAFPGTEVIKMAEDNIGGLHIKHTDWSRYSKQEGSTIGLDNLSYQDLKKYQIKAYLAAYVTNRKIYELIKMVGFTKLVKLSLKNLYRMVVGEKVKNG